MGWNQVEYQALNQNFHNRGKRIEEQIEVLNLLWTKPLVNYRGRWHSVLDAGINPLPIQQPIPLWFGGHSKQVVQRVVKYGQGWLPNYRLPGEAKPTIEKLLKLGQETNRDPNHIGIEARLHYGEGNPNVWEALIHQWREVGATHLTLNTMGSGLNSASAHIEAIKYFAIKIGITK